MTELSESERLPLARPARPRWIGGAQAFLTENPLLIALVVMIAFFASQSSGFLIWDNWRGILLQASALAVVALPQALLVIAGYLDLSVGSMLGMTGVLAGYLMVSTGWAPLPASLAAIGLGAALGLLNGLTVCWLGFSAIVVTLGMLTLVRGLTFLITDQTVSVFGDGFSQLGNGSLVGVPIPVLIAAGVLAAGAVFLAKTPWGRYVYAIGVNRDAAYLSGLPVRGLPTMLFVLSGVGSALGGLLVISRLDSAPASSLGVGFELSVLTAVLLGGIAFSGGRGSVFGVLLGVLFLGVLQNGLALLDVPFAWQQFASGLALVAAAGLQVLGTRLGDPARGRPGRGHRRRSPLRRLHQRAGMEQA
jgi:ribose transport system permease protein